MKIYLTMTILCLGLLCHSQHKNDTSKFVPVYADFSGLQCDGKHQLCSLSRSDQNVANATLVNNHNGTISLLIPRISITNEDTVKLFGSPFHERFKSTPVNFGVQKEIVLTTRMQQELQTDSNTYTLAQGFYPITITDTHFVITFNLR